jgi:hypothetical protein
MAKDDEKVLGWFAGRGNDLWTPAIFYSQGLSFEMASRACERLRLRGLLKRFDLCGRFVYGIAAMEGE